MSDTLNNVLAYAKGRKLHLTIDLDGDIRKSARGNTIVAEAVWPEVVEDYVLQLTLVHKLRARRPQKRPVMLRRSRIRGT